MMRWLLAEDAPPSASLLMLALFVGVGMLLIGLSIPLVRRRVKPNPLYGFRTPKTFRNERIWYEANAYSGRLLLRLGLVVIVAAVGLYLVLGSRFVAFSLAWAAVQLGGLAITAFLSFRYLRSL